MRHVGALIYIKRHSHRGRIAGDLALSPLAGRCETGPGDGDCAAVRPAVAGARDAPCTAPRRATAHRGLA